MKWCSSVALLISFTLVFPKTTHTNLLNIVFGISLRVSQAILPTRHGSRPLKYKHAVYVTLILEFITIHSFYFNFFIRCLVQGYITLLFCVYIIYTVLGKVWSIFFYSKTTVHNATKLCKIVIGILVDVLVFFRVSEVTEVRPVEYVVIIFILKLTSSDISL